MRCCWPVASRASSLIDRLAFACYGPAWMALAPCAEGQRFTQLARAGSCVQSDRMRSVREDGAQRRPNLLLEHFRKWLSVFTPLVIGEGFFVYRFL